LFVSAGYVKNPSGSSASLSFFRFPFDGGLSPLPAALVHCNLNRAAARRGREPSIAFHIEIYNRSGIVLSQTSPLPPNVVCCSSGLLSFLQVVSLQIKIIYTQIPSIHLMCSSSTCTSLGMGQYDLIIITVALSYSTSKRFRKIYGC
jgi:hypothetical protein